MNIHSASLEKDLEDFTRIVHKGMGTLILKKGTQNHIRISANPDILDSIRAEVFAGMLEIRMKDAVSVGLKSLLRLEKPDYKIEVTYTELTELQQRGVGNVLHEGVMELPKFKIENRGVGDVTLHIHSKELDTKLLGVGNISLQGEVENHSVEIKGTGGLDAHELETKNTRIVNAGVGTSRVNATEQLYAELNGVGKITYRGNPRVESKLNGIGSIASE